MTNTMTDIGGGERRLDHTVTMWIQVRMPIWPRCMQANYMQVFSL